MINLALTKLGIIGYIFDDEPTNEIEFNKSFKRIVGEDENATAILSSDPKDFGVTWAQIQAEIEKLKIEIPLNKCKTEAKKRIAVTDWAVLPDVGISNVAEFEAYRAALREIIKNPVLDPEYPTEPNPVWI
jgi:hypothetical protein